MNIETFAATRNKRLVSADEEMREFVTRGLNDFSGQWYSDIVEAASVLWLETYQFESPAGDYQVAMKAFQEMLRETLAKTTDPGSPASEVAIDRLTKWIGTATVNDATFRGNKAAGARSMRWITQGDGNVRDIHRAVDGARRSIAGTFDVGGFKLHYPGEPVGPPEVWINCRCLLASGRVEPVSTNITAAGTLPEDEEMPETPIPRDDAEAEVPEEVIAEEPLVDDELDEIPVHGVAAPEGVPTGDGREFGVGSLTTRTLPLPMRYEIVGTHGGTTSDVVTVGRIDEMWMQDGEMRYRGALLTNRQYTEEVVQGIADGSIRGISVEVDSMELDIETTMASMAKAEQTGAQPVETLKAARIAGFTIVPIPAYQEAYIALGAAFEDELTEEDQAALVACGCGNAVDEDEFELAGVVDLTGLSETDLDAYFELTPEEQEAFVAQRGLLTTVEAVEEALVAAGTYAPGTKDGPGWITHPRATSRIRRYWTQGKGAAKIKWGMPGDFNRCRRQLAKYVKNPDYLAGTCANMHKEALGVWPGQEAGGRGRHALIAAGGVVAPAFTFVGSDSEQDAFVAAGSYADMKAEWFQNPNFTGPTQLTITEDGRVFGHLAVWTTCHIGIPGVCSAAPHSPSNYSYFHTGRIATDQGDVRVGNLTHGIGHASLRARAAAATAHYDQTSAVWAHVAVGEDAHGIWYSGVVKPGVSKDKIAEIRAIGALSGDWRYPEGQLDLVAAVSVGTPGLPVRAQIAAENGHQTALIASAGIVLPETIEEPAQNLSAAEVAGIARAAVAEFIYQGKREERISKLAGVREKSRAFRLNRAREALKRGE